MVPIVALVGRPNVGKSTLFNCLTRTRDAIVSDQPGLTRDRHYAATELDGRAVILVDTGGIGEETGGIDDTLGVQTARALEEAQLVLFLVDAGAGLCAGDEAIAGRLRRSGASVLLVMNKIDGVDEDVAAGEFHALGFGAPFPVSAAHARGTRLLAETCVERLPEAAADMPLPGAPDALRVAIAGRPNVGKSTLVNRILGEERVVVYDEPGTTRDSIAIPFQRGDQAYTLIDTAGIRRRGKVHEVIEKVSVLKTLQSIQQAHVVILLMDASEGIVEQDLHLLGQVLDAGRDLVVASNKWDIVDDDQRARVEAELDRRLRFLPWARLHRISARQGRGVKALFRSVEEAWRNAGRQWETSLLTRLLEDMVESHAPPAVRGRRIKLRYAHQGGSFPPKIIIHGNQTDAVPPAYRRYLENSFRQALELRGTALRIEFRTGDNPYAGRRNKLTPRQERSRKRLRRHTKR